MTKKLISIVFIFAASWMSAATVGETAPAFTLTDANGTTHSLSDFAGKTVVLEWFNPNCPFVVKFYDSSNMQKTQEKWTDKGVVWLAINSTNPDHRDFLTAEQHIAYAEEKETAATAFLLDKDGTVGQAYGARTTPHMYVISPEGTLVYNGAIDSIRSASAKDIAKAENFVNAALTSLMAGEEIAQATTRPYGCSVKY